MSSWRFDWIYTWDDVWGDDFMVKWRKIMEAAYNAHVYFEPEMVRAWYESYNHLRDISPRFLVASFDNETEVFLPLIFDRGRLKDGWHNTLYPAGQYGFDYHDPVATTNLSDESKKLFWGGLKEEILKMCDRVDTVVIPRLRETWNNTDNNELKPVANAPFIDLRDFKTAEDFVLTLPKQLRQEIRRQPRRLKDLGTLELKVITDVDRALEMVPVIEKNRKKRWPYVYMVKDFYRNLVKFGIDKGIVHLSVLESSGQQISWHLGFVYKNTYYYYVPVFDQKKSNYSPCKVHLAMLVEDAINRRYKIFDFLQGEEPYKLRWSNGNVGLFEYGFNMCSFGSRGRNKIRDLFQYASFIKKRILK